MTRSTPNSASQAFLRSINLRLDITRPKNIEHFYPTTKNGQIIDSICGLTPDRVSIASAAFGTGKSLTAAFSAVAIESLPNSHASLLAVAERCCLELAKTREFIQQRARRQGPRGLALVLDGYIPYLGYAMNEAAETAFHRLGLYTPRKALLQASNITETLEAIVARAQYQGLDRIAIVWDEFGRHLEGLIGDARAHELSILQTLAEYVARKRNLPITLTLLLHQSFFNYTGQLNQTARNEWRKIEGRFRTIDYFDDSREMYELLGHVIATQHQPSEVDTEAWVMIAEQLLGYGLFKVFKNPESLAKLLAKTAPYDPAVVFLLPRLAARIAQNERTLFNFLHSMIDRPRVSLADLYAFFAPAMRADTSVGGTYRQWLEAESAISKAQSLDEEDAIKATCLMSLGLTGSRFRVGLGTLIAAAGGLRADDCAAMEAAVKQLIKRKLLLYRRHNDEVSVWHGTDADLRGRLDEEILRAGPSFDLMEFLGKESPPPTWRPVEYNSQYLIRRYYASTYLEGAELLRLGALHPLWLLAPGEDGRIIYALPQDTAEIDALQAFAREMPDNPGLVLAIPSQPWKAFDAALEVWCLTRLQNDCGLLDSDPLIRPELSQMTDDARLHLAHIMDRMQMPREQGPSWFSRGKSLNVKTPADLRRELSRLMYLRFNLTPRINSEALVRRRLSRPMINARKKLVLGILERTGQPDLRFSGTTPDASMYRTVIRNTGLYHEKEPGIWGWVRPEDLIDRGLRQVWEAFRLFFAEPHSIPKCPAELFQTLLSPPFGLRPGLLPVLFAAGLKAFPSALSILREGIYLTDILPSDIEALCAEPHRFSVHVYNFGPDRRRYLSGFLRLFGGDPDIGDVEAVRHCFDALDAWKRGLPPAVWTTRQLDAESLHFREILRTGANPATFLFEQLPALAGHPESEVEALLSKIALWRDALSNVTVGYLASAASTVRGALGGQQGDLKDVACQWSKKIPLSSMDNQSHRAKAILRIIRQAGDGTYDLAQFLDALATVLVEKPTSRWEDATTALFAERLRNSVRNIEDAAISNGSGTQIVELVEDRVSKIYAQFVQIVGPIKAREFIEKIHSEDLRDYGNPTRST